MLFLFEKVECIDLRKRPKEDKRRFGSDARSPKRSGGNLGEPASDRAEWYGQLRRRYSYRTLVAGPRKTERACSSLAADQHALKPATAMILRRRCLSDEMVMTASAMEASVEMNISLPLT